ncbi:MAG: PAS domain S-box protein, partial [bacterium]
QRNLSPECVKALADLSVESAALPDAAPGTGPGDGPGPPGSPPACLRGGAGAPRSLALVPILHQGRLVATMIAGASTYPAIPPSLRAGLRSLGATVGYAISRISAEQSRGDAVADLEAVIALAPVAAWVLDAGGRITMWNRAAERLLGWKASEVLSRLPPFTAGGQEAGSVPPAALGPHQTSLSRRDGDEVEVRLVATAFRDVIGGASTTIVMAEDLTLERRLAEMERRLAASDTGSGDSAQAEQPGPSGAAAAGTRPTTRVLVIDAHDPLGTGLTDILSELGYESVRYGSVSEAADTLATADTEGRPFALAIVDLLAPDGSSALDQKAALRSLGLKAPVIVLSDADVHGHEQHGFAAAIRRPYDAAAVERAIRTAL